MLALTSGGSAYVLLNEYLAGSIVVLMLSGGEALAAVYSASSLEDARAKQALSRAALNAVREEVLRKTRIPIEIVTQVMDEIFQSMAATLKAARGKTLSLELINQLFDEFRSIPAKLKW